MKRERVVSGSRLQFADGSGQSETKPRPSVEFGLMYSAQDASGELIMGDGMVTDLSPTGLGIRGNACVTSGMELTIFLYLPDGQRPAVRDGSEGGLGSRTSFRSRDPQDEPARTKPTQLLLALKYCAFQLDRSSAHRELDGASTEDRQTSEDPSPSSGH